MGHRKTGPTEDRALGRPGRKDPTAEDRGTDDSAWRRDRARILPAFLLAPIAGFWAAYLLVWAEGIGGNRDGTGVLVLLGGFLAGALIVTLIGLVVGPPVMFVIGLPVHALVSRIPVRLAGAFGAALYGLAGGAAGFVCLLAFYAMDRGGFGLSGFGNLPVAIPEYILGGLVAGLIFWRLRIGSRRLFLRRKATHG